VVRLQEATTGGKLEEESWSSQVFICKPVVRQHCEAQPRRERVVDSRAREGHAYAAGGEAAACFLKYLQ